jgi:hypothetical protein
MQRSTFLFIISLLCFFLFTAQANAYQCVNDNTSPENLAANFQLALDDISTDNEIRLIAGTYTIPANSSGHFQVSANHSLQISGGWNKTRIASSPFCRVASFKIIKAASCS